MPAQVQSREQQRLRALAEAEMPDDPVIRDILAEEEEARILDVRADDVSQSLEY